MILGEAINNSDTRMYMTDLHSGEYQDLSSPGKVVKFWPLFFNPSSTHLYYLTNEDYDFDYLVKRDMKTGEVSEVFKTEWDVTFSSLSENENYLSVVYNENAKSVAKIFDLETNREVEMPEIEGSISKVKFSKSEEFALLTVYSSTSPNNLYLLNLKSKTHKKLTHTLNPEMEESQLVKGRLVSFPSSDGMEIPAIFFQPHQASETEPVPAIIFAHGGPRAQSRLVYSSFIQYLTNQGYAVLAVNPRGSTGYGKAFSHLDDKKHGEENLQDYLSGKEFLASTSVIDMDKLGIIGGSYGGFIVLSALTQYPEEFQVGVDLYGVSNWVRTLRSIPPQFEYSRQWFYQEHGDPFTEDSIRLFEISPLHHANKITRPLIVLQGANDPRVLQAESDEIVEAVKANGVHVEYIIFEDEGHGFLKKENVMESNKRVTEFLDRFLKGDG